MSNDNSRRIGVLVPLTNAAHAREFAQLCPPGVRFEFREFANPRSDSANFCDELLARMAPAMRELTDWGAEAVLLGCTAATMQCGSDECFAQFEALAGVPVVTAARAARDAAAALKLQRLCVATPYSEPGNQAVRRYLESQSIAVSGIRGLGCDTSAQAWAAGLRSLTPQRLLELGQSADSPQAQALYFPCTAVDSLATIELYERATGKPAISSVQAGFWAMLRRLGLDGRQAGAGRLLREWPV